MTAELDSAFDAEPTKVIEVAREVTSTATMAGTADRSAPLRLSAAAIQKAAVLGLSMGSEARCALMNELGKSLRIPSGGYKGQSCLIEHGDVRLAALLRVLIEKKASAAAAANLQLADTLVCQATPELKLSPFLIMTTSAREGTGSLTDRSTRRIHTFDEGGIDYLSKNMKRLGLPEPITRLWTGSTPFVNEETGDLVYPAEIPGLHQVLAYAAQTRLSFADFLNWLRIHYAAEAPRLEGSLIGPVRRVWQAFAFLAPAGRRHRCGDAPNFKKHFGVKTAVDYLDCVARSRHVPLDLNEVLDDVRLHSYRIKSAKMRAVESIFFEQLLADAGYPEESY